MLLGCSPNGNSNKGSVDIEFGAERDLINNSIGKLTLDSTTRALQGSSTEIFSFTQENMISLSCYYSTDMGSNWNKISDLQTTDSSFSWPLPLIDNAGVLVKIQGIDQEGNTISSQITIEIDSTPPDPPIASLSSSTPTGDINATITIASCSDIDSILVNESSAPSKNDSTWQNCTTTISGTIYEIINTSGLHNLKVWAKDEAGNISNTSTDLAVTLDLTAPLITLTSLTGGNKILGGSVQNITWTPASDDNLASTPISLEYSTDSGSNWTSIATNEDNDGSYSWTVPSLTNTSARVRVIASDSFSNQGFSASSSDIIIDSTGPDLTSFSITEGSNTSDNSIQVNLNATDDVDIDKICLKWRTTGDSIIEPDENAYCWSDIANSASLSITNFPFTIGEEDGSYDVYAWAIDELGNVSSLSNSGAGTVGIDKASITQGFICPYTLPSSVTISDVYPTYDDWNEWILFDEKNKAFFEQDETQCTAAAINYFSDCMHAGIVKSIPVTGVNSCDGLTIADDLGVYEFDCDDSSGTATFYSKELKRGKGLRHLVNATSWKVNEVTINCGVQLTTSSSTTWFDNPVVVAPDNSDETTDTMLPLDEVDDDGAGPDQAYTSKTIFTISGGVVDTVGYNLNLSGTSFVVIDGSTLRFAGWEDTDGELDADEDNYTFSFNGTKSVGADGIPDSVTSYQGNHLLVSSVSHNPTYHRSSLLSCGDTNTDNVWIEGDFDCDNGAGLKAELVYYTRYCNLFNFRNMEVKNCSYAGIFPWMGKGQRIRSVNAHHNEKYGIVLQHSNGSIVSQSVLNNNLFNGVFSANLLNNTYHQNIVSNNGGIGFYNNVTNTSYIIENLITSNGSVGFTTRGADTIFKDNLIINNGSHGIRMGNSYSTDYYKNSIINNNGSAIYFMNNSDGNDFSYIYAANNTSDIDVHTSNAPTCNNNTFGDYIFVGSTNSCTFHATSTGNNITTGLGVNCTKNDGSAAITSGADGANTFEGPLTSSDNSNTSPDTDNNGIVAYSSITDWVNFDNLFRTWGASSSDSLFTTNHQADCSVGDCQIWDYRLKSSDTQLRNRSVNGSTENAVFEPREYCPSFLHGNETFTTNNGEVILKHANEIVWDVIGDDDGLCESNEACIYTPNFGTPYQGSGDYTSNFCIFQDGTISGVKMYAYPTN